MGKIFAIVIAAINEIGGCVLISDFGFLFNHYSKRNPYIFPWSLLIWMINLDKIPGPGVLCPEP